MIPAIFTVGGAVSHEAENIKTTNENGRPVTTCDIRGVRFRGKEEHPEYDRYAFILRNKSDGKIKVIERPPLYFRPCMADEGVDPGTITLEVEQGALAENFGSSKVRKMISDNKAREKITGKFSDLKAAVTAATQEVKKKEENPISRVIPPILDLNAKTPHGVYDMNVIFPPNVQQDLAEAANELIQSTLEQRKEWLQQNTYCKLVIDRLSTLPHNPNEKLEAAKRLAFLNAMSQMYRKPAKQLRVISALAAVPQEVAQHLFIHFTLLGDSASQKIRLCPLWMKDKLLCHMLVVLLYHNNFSLNIEELVSHFKISSQKLTKFVTAIGCKIQNADRKKTAVLKTPVVLRSS